MVHGLQSFGRAQIDSGKGSQTEGGFAEVGLPEICPIEVRLERRLRPAEVRPVEVVHPAEDRGPPRWGPAREGSPRLVPPRC